MNDFRETKIQKHINQHHIKIAQDREQWLKKNKIKRFFLKKKTNIISFIQTKNRIRNLNKKWDK